MEHDKKEYRRKRRSSRSRKKKGQTGKGDARSYVL